VRRPQDGPRCPCHQADFGGEPYLIEIGNRSVSSNVAFITHDGATWCSTSPPWGCRVRADRHDNCFIGANASSCQRVHRVELGGGRGRGDHRSVRRLRGRRRPRPPCCSTRVRGADDLPLLSSRCDGGPQGPRMSPIYDACRQRKTVRRQVWECGRRERCRHSADQAAGEPRPGRPPLRLRPRAASWLAFPSALIPVFGITRKDAAPASDGQWFFFFLGVRRRCFSWPR
jgi:hypothetical protein